MDIQPVVIEEMEVQSAVIEERDTITTQEEMNTQPIRKEQDQGESKSYWFFCPHHEIDFNVQIKVKFLFWQRMWRTRI